MKPPVMVRPKSPTVAVLLRMSKTRKASLPLMTTVLATLVPRKSGKFRISRLLVICNSPEVSPIVFPASSLSKMIASPLAASRIACRNDPGPASLVLRTTSVLGKALPSSTSSRGRKR